MLVEEALARVLEWERAHGHEARLACASKQYAWDLGEPRITPEQQEEGANRWLDYQEALRREEHQRRIAAAERDEAFGQALMDAASEEPLPPGALDAIRRYAAG